MTVKDEYHLETRLSNQRTFLSWIRTCLGIMAFGFAVERFNLFGLNLRILLNNAAQSNVDLTTKSFQIYSDVFGIGMVAFGSILALFSLVMYIKTDRQLLRRKYKPPYLTVTIIAIFCFLIGVLLIITLLPRPIAP